jgi:DNA-binding MarR family transcriptional regulator
VTKRGTGEERKAGRFRRSSEHVLSGTTRRVYRYIYRRGPVRLHEIQRELGFSSPSVADYHIQKLLNMKLIRERTGPDDQSVGYVAEEAIFEAMVRIRRTVIPLWTTATAFFGAGLIALLTLFRPASLSSSYLFSLIIAVAALSISVHETVESLRKEAL